MRIRARDEGLVGAISTVDVVPRAADVDAGPDPVACASGPPRGVLDVSIRRRGKVVELRLAGALDTATAQRLGEAMELAREMATQRTGHPPAARDVRRSRATILIDTSDIDDVDPSGYRALQEALVGPNGLWDRGVDWIVGPAVATFEASIGAAPERSRPPGS